VERGKKMLSFASVTDEVNLRMADELLAAGKVEQAFTKLMDGIRYIDGE
jgi:hypothetical protein